MNGVLADPANEWILRSGATVTAALIAAVTALLVAFVAYPWQKSRDHKQQLKSEKRASYRRFINEANSFFGRVALGDKLTDSEAQQEHYLKVVASMSDLIVYAPEEVIKSCQAYSQTLFTFSDAVSYARELPGYRRDPKANTKELYKETKLKRRAAMLKIREDLSEGKDGSAKKAVDAFFVLTPADGAET